MYDSGCGKVSRFGKFKGVTVPGVAERGVPWDVARKWTSGIKMQETLDEIGSEEDEDFDHQIDDTFAHHASQREEALSSVIVGQSYEEMMQELAQAPATPPSQAAEDSVDSEASDVAGHSRQLMTMGPCNFH